MLKKISDKIKKFPLKSGVYLFLGKKDKVLYVGRAVSLKKRTLDYTRKNLDLRIKEMTSLANDIKFYKTDNLLEAVILEANLIKKYWPKYNIKEKDNRSFIYIAISKKDDFPKPIIVRGQEIENFKFQKDSFYIFGPYQSLNIVVGALRIIRKIFPYSLCKFNQGKPCFDYQIGLCPGVCIGEIDKKDYKKNIDNIILLLSGKKKRLIEKLKKENSEKAKFLKHIQDVSLIVREESSSRNFYRIEGYDISHFAGQEIYGSMVVFIDNRPDKNAYRIFKIKEAPKNDDLRALAEIISRRFHHQEWRLPDLILIDGGRPQISFIDKIFKNLKIKIPFAGISKLAGDKLVFSVGVAKNLKELISSNKQTLLKVRDEAHRFAISAGRRRRRKNYGG
ncbi:hypothetical protein JW698_02355 [Candidatus Wolfebacteria bacterium]|nr:hypothetical protein [Candidatus Wolfebacteria bacterium]